ncbi:MAG: agmatinase family protein [Chitinophagales bacterium]|nr:agmatinase family protein [Bacteroidota bacterium]MCB9042583.1 agmatinase family protein [Chitinophagales bacterium]
MRSTLSKQEQIDNFDPNGVGAVNGKIFGLPFTYQTAPIVVIPVPWDMTVSYLDGTSRGAQAILDYSPQIDLHDLEIPNAWKAGIFMLDTPKKIKKLNKKMRPLARQHIESLEKNTQNTGDESLLKKLNEASAQLNQYVFETATNLLSEGKIPAVLGGDHSSPLGLIQALANKHKSFGILQIDAHADLRIAYEDFTYSHASIMYNASQIPSVKKIVSVGIRDICTAEIDFAGNSNGQIVHFYDENLKKEQLSGQKNWAQQCKEIVKLLPKNVYISFDIDGLKPEFCPATGTPVPGGLSLYEAFMLLETITHSGKKIIGFDLCEVSVGKEKKVSPQAEYNANVGARVLYKLCNRMALSQKVIG